MSSPEVCIHSRPASNFDDSDEDVVPLKVPVIQIQPYMEIKVKNELQDICSSIKTAFDERFVCNPSVLKASEIFHSDLEWFTEVDRTSEDADNIETGTDFCTEASVVKAEELMEALMATLPVPLVADLDLDNVVVGFLIFIQFLKKERNLNGVISLKKCYEKFYRLKGTSEDCVEFTILFEKCQIKSFSEVRVLDQQ